MATHCYYCYDTTLPLVASRPTYNAEGLIDDPINDICERCNAVGGWEGVDFDSMGQDELIVEKNRLATASWQAELYNRMAQKEMFENLCDKVDKLLLVC